MGAGPLFLCDGALRPTSGRRAPSHHRPSTSAAVRGGASLQDVGVKRDSLSKPPTMSILFIDGPVVLG